MQYMTQERKGEWTEETQECTARRTKKRVKRTNLQSTSQLIW